MKVTKHSLTNYSILGMITKAFGIELDCINDILNKQQLNHVILDEQYTIQQTPKIKGVFQFSSLRLLKKPIRDSPAAFHEECRQISHNTQK